MAVAEFDCDVVIIGGGPAGSVAASTLQKLGRTAIILEKAKFPRYHIGESLLPQQLSILSLIGVMPEIEAANFTRKVGGVFRWGASPTPWTFDFKDDPLNPYDHSYQVVRSEFDHILLKHAAKLGADVREEAVVQDVVESDDGVVVTYTDNADPLKPSRQVRGRFLVDASGQEGFIARKRQSREYDKLFTNMAVWTYYNGATRMEAPRDGSILCAAYEWGWFWCIPLKDGTMSVGTVIDRSMVDTVKQMGIREFMAEAIRRCDLVAEMLATAVPIAADPHMIRDYSYRNRQAVAGRVLLAGDAAHFIDPLFSSGVHLATSSAHLAALAIDHAMTQPDQRDAVWAFYDREYGKNFESFHKFLTFMYDAHAAESNSFFWQARKVLEGDERLSNRAWFVRLVSGGSHHLLKGAGRDMTSKVAGMLGTDGATLVSEMRGVEADSVVRLFENVTLKKDYLVRADLLGIEFDWVITHDDVGIRFPAEMVPMFDVFKSGQHSLRGLAQNLVTVSQGPPEAMPVYLDNLMMGATQLVNLGMAEVLA